MFVSVTEERGNRKVMVLGESLEENENGYYLLPSRLVRALKPEDLPVGIGFALDGALPSGYGFYREDTVVFRRVDDSSTLWIEVTSTYDVSEWDGLFSLEATLHARKQVIEQKKDFVCVLCEPGDVVAKIRYDFPWVARDQHDLEQALECICDTVYEVEARGNARLWPGCGRPFEEG